MHRIIQWLLHIAVLTALLTTPALAGKRVALVIGNAKYQHTAELKSPTNDARVVAGALKSVGFEVIEGLDLTEIGMQRAISEFSVKLQTADVGLLYYAGHGLQVDGKNYLVPIDASLDNKLQLPFQTISADRILNVMESTKRISILLLDACRNNPLAERLSRSLGAHGMTLGRGLAKIEAETGTYIGYSNQPGNVALDGDGKNSPFATALVDKIKEPNVDIELMMRKVRADVIAMTRGYQVPWGNSSLVGGFMFAKRDVSESESRPPVVVPLPPPYASAREKLAMRNETPESRPASKHLVVPFIFAGDGGPIIGGPNIERRPVARPSPKPTAEASALTPRQPVAVRPPPVLEPMKNDDKNIVIGKEIAAPETNSAMTDFPIWPPPYASAWDVIPDKLVTAGLPREPSYPTLYAVSQRLGNALDAAGYYERSFFAVPNGFAIVTQLERIGPDGTPDHAQRWVVDNARQRFSLAAYLSRLLYAQPGYFRLVVFVVTDVVFRPDRGSLSKRDAQTLVTKGTPMLPFEMATHRMYSARFNCTALIYEFEKDSDSASAHLVVPSQVPGREHLIKSGVWAYLVSNDK